MGIDTLFNQWIKNKAMDGRAITLISSTNNFNQGSGFIADTLEDVTAAAGFVSDSVETNVIESTTINASDINDCPIGATVPSTATFTKLDTTRNVTFQGSDASHYVNWNSQTNKFEIQGDFNVTGQQTILKVITMEVDDPILQISSASVTNPTDIGIQFAWQGSTTGFGFFGVDTEKVRFRFLPESTNISEGVTGTLGNFEATTSFVQNLESESNLHIRSALETDIQSTGNIFIDSAVGTINIGTDNNTGAINIGTNASQRTITIGNDASTTVDVNAQAIELDAAATIQLTSETTTDIQAKGNLSMDSETGNINLGTDNNTGAINIGTNASQRTITIGNDASTAIDMNAQAIELDAAATIQLTSETTTDIQAKGNLSMDSENGNINLGTDSNTGAINIGTNANARTITIGNDASSTVDVNAQAIELDAAATIQLTSETTTDIQAKGNLSMDSENGNINLGTDSNTGAINIGTNANARTITIGNDASSTVDVNAQAIELDAAATIQLTSETTTDIQARGNLSLDSETGNINLGTDSNTGAINIGTNANARTITVGNDASTAVDLNALSIELDAAATIQLTSETTTDIQAKGNLSMDSENGNINLGTDNNTGAINIGTNASQRTITIGNDVSTAIDMNAQAIELDAAATIQLTSETTTDIQAKGNLSMDSENGNINLGTDSNTGAINIGTNANARTITIGNDASSTVDVNAQAIELDAAATIQLTSETTTDIQAKGNLSMDSENGNINLGTDSNTGAINIGTNANARTITVGNDASTAVDLNALSIELDAAATIQLTSETTTDIQAKGNLSMDSENGNINLGTDNNTGAINIGTNASQRTITIGNDASTAIDMNAQAIELDAAATIQLTSETTTDIQAKGNLSMDSENGNINLGTDSNTGAINIGTNANARTITIGNDASSTVDVNAQAIELDAAATIQLTSETTTDIQARGNLSLDSETGNINLGTDNNTGAINIGTNASQRTITIGNDVSTAIDMNAQAIELDAAATIQLTSETTTDIQAKGNLSMDSENGNINLGTDSNTGAINIGTNASQRTITIGNDASTAIDMNAQAIELDAAATIQLTSETTTDIQAKGTLTLDSETGNIDIGTDSNTGAINIGTNANARTITVGNDASTAVDLNALSIELDAAATIQLTSETTTDIQAKGNLSMDSETGNINLGTDSNTGAINIGTNANARTITIGNDASTAIDMNAQAIELDAAATIQLTSETTTDIQAKGTLTLDSETGNIDIGTDSNTGAINIGTNANARTITIGNDASTAIDMNAQAIELDAAATIQLTSETTTDIQAKGTLTLDSETGNIDIGTDSNTGAINIGTNANARTITVGNDASTAVDLNALSIELGAAATIQLTSETTTDIQAKGTLTLDSETGNIDIGTDSNTGAINIGTNANARTITVGNDASTTVDVNAQAIELDAAATIQLTSETTTDIQAKGTLTLDSETGNIDIGTDSNTGAINIGTNANARTITVGNDASTAVDLNALSIELDAAATIQLTSETTTDIQAKGTLTLDSETGNIDIGTDSNTGAINIGTNANARTITVGNDASTTVDVNAQAIELDAAATIQLTSETTTDIQAKGNLSMDSENGNINLGTDSNTGAINIGTNANARTITVGNDASTAVDLNALSIELDAAATIQLTSETTTDIQAKGTLTLDSETGNIDIGTDNNTGAINIGTNASQRTITIGNDASTAVDLNALSIELDAAATIQLTSETTTDIQAKGNLSLDSETGNIDIGTDNNTGAINIGTNASQRTITVGNDASTAIDLNALSIELDAAATIQLTSETTTDIQAKGTLTLDSETGNIDIGTDNNTGAINIGTNASQRTITVGNDASTAIDLNALSIELDAAATIQLTSETTTDIQAKGTLTLDSETGNIDIGTDSNTGAINIGTNANARTITVGNDASTAVDLNALSIELDAAATIQLTSETTTDIQAKGTLTLDSDTGIHLKMPNTLENALTIGTTNTTYLSFDTENDKIITHKSFETSRFFTLDSPSQISATNKVLSISKSYHLVTAGEIHTINGATAGTLVIFSCIDANTQTTFLNQFESESNEIVGNILCGEDRLLLYSGSITFIYNGSAWNLISYV